MKKIFELLGLSSALKGDVGIEIECEGNNLKMAEEKESKYWKTVNDGSLRGEFPNNAAEYVLVRPIAMPAVKDALTELGNIQKDSILKFSFRTSVHVHVNVQTLTELQLLNFVYLYLLLEEPLMNYCGKERKGNRFCLRLADAENMLDAITKWVTGHFDHIRLLPEGMRYSSINLAAIKKYGSVEFRGMRGTMDQGVLLNWVTALHTLREHARTARDPQEIYEAFCNAGVTEFIAKIFGDQAPLFMYPRVEQDVCRSFSLSIDLPAMFIRHKERFTEEPPKEKKTKYQEMFEKVRAEEDFVPVNHAGEGVMDERAWRDIPMPPIAPVPRVRRPINPIIHFDDVVPAPEEAP